MGGFYLCWGSRASVRRMKGYVYAATNDFGVLYFFAGVRTNKLVNGSCGALKGRSLRTFEY